jgi:hypothetical protein
MVSSTGWRRRATGLAAVGVGCALAAAALGAAPAGAAGTGATGQGSVIRSDGVLSGRLTALSDPALAAASASRQARSLSLAEEGTGSLVRADGAVLVQALLDDTGSATVAELEQVGDVINVSAPMSRATLLVTPARLADLAAVPAV